MLDPKLLRNDLQMVADKLATRGYQLPSEKLQALETTRKQLQTKTQELQSARNKHSKAIGQAKGKGEDTTELMQEMQQVNAELTKAEAELEQLQAELKAIHYEIPNIPHESVPLGKSETDNVEVRTWGELPSFDYTPQDHVDLGERMQQMDFAMSAKISGARFVVLRDGLAKLHRALTQFMLETHTQKHGYQEVYVPYLVNEASLYGTTQLPKFADDLFTTDHESKLRLIPTAEVPLTNFARDHIFQADELPMAITAHTPCFRSEAGSYGKDTRGMFRQHQFEKVELVHFAKPSESYQIHEQLTQHAEAILQALQLPYRVVTLCTGDIGFGAAKTYDIEVWLPGQQNYREISSCSNFEDFQARRMHARWRNPETGKPELIHTLNGSGLAVGRCLIAVLENYQDEQGRVRVPEVLRPYLGRDFIG